MNYFDNAIAILNKEGWQQTLLGGDGEAKCLYGAMNFSILGTANPPPRWSSTTPKASWPDGVHSVLMDTLREEDPEGEFCCPMCWNDEPGRGYEEVITLLTKASERWEARLASVGNGE